MAIRRHHRVLLASAIALSAGLAPLTTANADTTTGPSVSLSAPNSIDLNGPSGDITIHISNPTSSDAYVRLYLSDGDGLTITDSTGKQLPVTQSTAHGQGFIDLGHDDSNHNGIPGAPLTAGDMTVHVAVAYPGGSSIVSAQILDGATGDILATTGRFGTQHLVVNGPDLQTGATTEPFQLYQGSGSADDDIDVPVPMLAPPSAFRLSLTFSAAQLAASGNTAQRVAANLHATCAVDQQPTQPCTWTVNADGSVTLHLPLAKTLFPAGATAHVQFHTTFSAGYWLHSGNLAGNLTLQDQAGNTLGRAWQFLNIAEVPAPQSLTGGLVARDSSGALWQYRSTGGDGFSPVFGDREYVGSGWNTYNLLASLDGQHGDGTGQLVARDRAGVLWLYRGSGDAFQPFKARVRVGGGWGGYTALVGAGDLTGNGHPDLLARDANGTLWLYQGTGNPTTPFQPRVRIGGGWASYTALVGAGDLTGNGHPDLLARDANGTLWLYQGTGNPTTPFQPRIRIGGGWANYTALTAVRDVTDDGHPDIVARDSSGQLWLYQGTGNAASPFLHRMWISHGWNTYTALV